VEAAEHMYPKF
jgi:hypothetical protein